TVSVQSQAVLHLMVMKVDADDWTGAVVTYTPAPFATDISGNMVAIDCVPPTGTRLPIGNTIVACTSGTGTIHEARGTFVVAVVDMSPPTVIVPPPIV